MNNKTVSLTVPPHVIGLGIVISVLDLVYFWFWAVVIVAVGFLSNTTRLYYGLASAPAQLESVREQAQTVEATFLWALGLGLASHVFNVARIVSALLAIGKSVRPIQRVFMASLPFEVVYHTFYIVYAINLFGALGSLSDNALASSNGFVSLLGLWLKLASWLYDLGILMYLGPVIAWGALKVIVFSLELYTLRKVTQTATSSLSPQSVRE